MRGAYSKLLTGQLTLFVERNPLITIIMIDTVFEFIVLCDCKQFT